MSQSVHRSRRNSAAESRIRLFVYLGVLIPPLISSNYRAIFSTPQACAFVAELLYESPKGLQLSDPTAKNSVVMNQTCRCIVPLYDKFPTPLVHVTPDAVAQVNLVTVNLTKRASIVRTPMCPVNPILKRCITSMS